MTAVGSPWGFCRRRVALRTVISGALALAGAGLGERAVHGATVTFTGPSSCADAGSIAEQASDLLGRPLAEVTGVDFEVALSKTGSNNWSLRLDTLEIDKSAPSAERLRRSREIRATKCAELADAAAVGIAMSVRALAEAEPPAAVSPTAASPPPVLVPPAPSSAVPSGRPAFVGRVAAVGDAGALPGPTIGLELGAALRLARLRLGLSGTALAPRTAQTTGTTGGQVSLLFGAVELCAPTGNQRIEVFGCGAFELGRIAAEGVGITRPRLGSVLWDAVRAELGLGLTLRPHLVLALRAGAALPLSRPEFVINGTIPVHRPSAVMARASAGVEFEF